MRLDDLHPSPGSRQPSSRRGRGDGSGQGGTGGRGHKGYHSRSGSKRRPWFEGGQMPLQRRVPKRGFSNLRFRKDTQIVNLSAIDALGLKEVDAQVLQDRRLVRSAYLPIKVLGSGNLSRAVQVTASAFSQRAIEKIEQAGGKVTVQ